MEYQVIYYQQEILDKLKAERESLPGVCDEEDCEGLISILANRL